MLHVCVCVSGREKGNCERVCECVCGVRRLGIQREFNKYVLKKEIESKEEEKNLKKFNIKTKETRFFLTRVALKIANNKKFNKIEKFLL